MASSPSQSTIESPEQLCSLADEILGYAHGYGLDPIPTVFELVDYDEIDQIAACDGFPTRYPHWRFGMAYDELRKQSFYGLSKIYELVINNEPSIAYLLRSNSLTDQKVVIAHVYGHADFFRHNKWYSQTNRKMISGMANHGTRIRRYIERYGHDRVERFIDCALSLENLIDFHSVFGPPRRPPPRFKEDEEPVTVRKIPSKDYMDRYINPPEFLEAQQRKIEEEAARKKKVPERPEKDVLYFLMEYAPLENWQRDILAIIRDEAYYFAPHPMTKIINEGWAAYWHSKIMTERLITGEEVVDYADHHSGVLADSPHVLNPYKLGLELFRDIEDRWNKGKFGSEWDQCDDAAVREDWDLKLGGGREKIFQVRATYNDSLFIDHFLTDDFCREQKFFVYRRNLDRGVYEISSQKFDDVKRTLLNRLTNAGLPRIRVADGNFRNRAELLLEHQHDGFDLDIEDTKETLKNLYEIWHRPVHLQTFVNNEPVLFSYDGKDSSDDCVDVLKKVS